MDVKQISALRKSGHLQEALQAAEHEFDRNANPYTAGALFWCLYDLCKQQSGEEAIATFERIEELACQCPTDEYMQNAYVAMKRKFKPHYQDVNDALEKAKNGVDAMAEYKHVMKLFDAGELDASLYQDFGWLTYYALKHTPLNDAHSRKMMLNQYFKLKLSRPSRLHSLILAEAVKVEQNTPLQFRIRDFIKMWGLENLRDDDWNQFTTDDGKTLPSLVEKLVGVYAKEVKTDGIVAPDEFASLVDEAMMRYPKNQNMPYYKAVVLISQGKKDEAVGYYRDLILRFPAKYYLWDHISSLIDDIDTKIGLLGKALSTGDDESFLGNVRLKMAQLLLQKGLAANAKYELEKYAETYRNNGWALKQDYKQVCNQLPKVDAAADNKPVYAEYASKAEEFIYSELPTVVAVKIDDALIDDRIHPGRKIVVWRFSTKDATLRLKKPAKFGLGKRMPNGSIFDIKAQDGKIVWIKPHIGVLSEDWLKESTGIVSLRTDRKGNRYAIVGGAYVDHKLLTSVAEGESVKILARQKEDGRWAAVSLTKMDR